MDEFAFLSVHHASSLVPIVPKIEESRTSSIAVGLLVGRHEHEKSKIAKRHPFGGVS